MLNGSFYRTRNTLILYLHSNCGYRPLFQQHTWEHLGKAATAAAVPTQEVMRGPPLLLLACTSTHISAGLLQRHLAAGVGGAPEMLILLVLLVCIVVLLEPVGDGAAGLRRGLAAQTAPSTPQLGFCRASGRGSSIVPSSSSGAC